MFNAITSQTASTQTGDTPHSHKAGPTCLHFPVRSHWASLFSVLLYSCLYTHTVMTQRLLWDIAASYLFYSAIKPSAREKEWSRVNSWTEKALLGVHSQNQVHAILYSFVALSQVMGHALLQFYFLIKLLDEVGKLLNYTILVLFITLYTFTRQLFFSFFFLLCYFWHIATGIQGFFL